MAPVGRAGAESERLIFVALWVQDLEASARFYRDLLEVPLHSGFNEPIGDPWLDGEHYEYSWMDGAYLHFALFPARPDGPTTTGVEISFVTADADAKHRALVAKGVEVIHEPRTWEVEQLRMARYRDPDGNIVAFTERVEDTL